MPRAYEAVCYFTGAFGYFEVTHDITQYTKAVVFSEVGKKTPIAVRFSFVTGETGSADTTRYVTKFLILLLLCYSTTKTKIKLNGLRSMTVKIWKKTFQHLHEGTEENLCRQVVSVFVLYARHCRIFNALDLITLQDNIL